MNRPAGEALLSEHLDLLRAYVRGRLGAKLRTKETSLDLVQSVCREALGDLSRFEERGEGSFRRWLLTRAENKIRDKGRFWNRDRRALDQEQPIVVTGSDGEDIGTGEPADVRSPADAAAAREELTRLEAAFAELPEDYRAVIVMTKLEGLGHDEVSERLGRTQAATRTLLCRALARLSTALEDEG